MSFTVSLGLAHSDFILPVLWLCPVKQVVSKLRCAAPARTHRDQLLAFSHTFLTLWIFITVLALHLWVATSLESVEHLAREELESVPLPRGPQPLQHPHRLLAVLLRKKLGLSDSVALHER